MFYCNNYLLTKIPLFFHRAKVEILRHVETEAKTLRTDIVDKDSLIASLKAELTQERDSNKLLKQEKKTIEEQYEKNRVAWEEESEKLAVELKSVKEHYELAIEGELLLFFIEIVSDILFCRIVTSLQ